MLKISINQLKSNLAINIMISVQLIIVFVLAIATSSIISYHYKYYNNFKDYFEAEGYMYNAEYFYVNDDDDDVVACNTWELEELLANADVTGCYSPQVNYYDGTGSALEMNAIAYDTDIVKRHTPDLAEGRWIENSSENEAYVEAVISPNDYGIGVGDTIFMSNLFFEYPEKLVEVRIVGMLEDNAKIVGYTENTFLNTSRYSDIYCDYSLENEGIPALLMNVENIYKCNGGSENPEIEAFVSGWVFITYSDDITEDEIIKNEQLLNKYAVTQIKEDMDMVAKNSRRQLNERMIAILPIFVGVLVLSVISSLCSVSVSVKKQMKNYAIYSICGMPWQKSSRISVLGTFILSLISLLSGLVCTGVIMTFNRETTIGLGVLQLVFCAGVILIYMAASSLMPSLIINGTSIKEVLRNNE